MAPPKTPLSGMVARYAGRLRFPQLLAITAALFALDLIVPDVIPFVDEILLALATVLFASWQKPSSDRG